METKQNKTSQGTAWKDFPAALTIAGSDSGGGAGIQADLRTFSSLGVFGCSAITALTAQNPHKVAGIFPADPGFVKLQIRTVLEDFRIKAIKTGMLFSKEIISEVAEALQDWTGPLVIDPVMISTSGADLLRKDARETLIRELLPRANWITPNIPEAEYLSGCKIAGKESLLEAAQICAEKFRCGIVLKGGHDTGKESADLILPGFGKEPYTLSTRRLDLPSIATHGTGCTFSAALTASLARGLSEKEALAAAKRFVFESLESVVSPGDQLWAMFPKGLLK